MIFPKLTILLYLLFGLKVLATPLNEFSLADHIGSENYQKIDFSTLTNHVIYEQIEDPFWELDFTVLDKLVVIVDYQDAEANGKSMTKAETQEHDKLKAELEAQEIDVDGLLDIRQQLIAQWEAQNESTNPLIVNKNIEIEGFVLPIEWQGKKLVEFLLVPFVGACIHKPTPPPNQIIYVKLKTPMAFSNLNTFASVTVKGFLTSELQSPELSLVDGKEPVTTSYGLNANSVEVIEISMNAW